MADAAAGRDHRDRRHHPDRDRRGGAVGRAPPRRRRRCGRSPGSIPRRSAPGSPRRSTTFIPPITSRSAGPAGSTGSGSSAWPRAAWRWRDAELDLAREDPGPGRRDDGHGAGRRGHGRERSTRRYVEGGIRAVDPSLALMVFAGAASCNVAIEFGVTGPNSTNGMSCASGTIAIGDGFRAIRAGRRRRDAGGRRRGAAGAAQLRGVRHHPRHVHPQRRPRHRQPPLRRRARRIRDGRGRGRAGARGARPRDGAGRADLRRDLRVRPDQRRPPHDRTAPRRARRRRAPCAWRWPSRDAAATEVGYVNAHGSSTPLNDSDRDRRHQAGVRGARAPAGHQRHQGLLRPRPRRERRDRGRHLRPGQSPAAGSPRPSTCGRPTPPATSTTSRPAAGRRTRTT